VNVFELLYLRENKMYISCRSRHQQHQPSKCFHLFSTSLFLRALLWFETPDVVLELANKLSQIQIMIMINRNSEYLREFLKNSSLAGSLRICIITDFAWWESC